MIEPGDTIWVSADKIRIGVVMRVLERDGVTWVYVITATSHGGTGVPQGDQRHIAVPLGTPEAADLGLTKPSVFYHNACHIVRGDIAEAHKRIHRCPLPLLDSFRELIGLR